MCDWLSPTWLSPINCANLPCNVCFFVSDLLSLFLCFFVTNFIIGITPKLLNESEPNFLCGIWQHTKFFSKYFFVTTLQGAGEGHHGPKCSRTLQSQNYFIYSQEILHVDRYYPRGVPFDIFKMADVTCARMREKNKMAEKKFSKIKNFLIQLERSCRTENEYVIIFFLRQTVTKWEPGKD